MSVGCVKPSRVVAQPQRQGVLQAEPGRENGGRILTHVYDRLRYGQLFG